MEGETWNPLGSAGGCAATSAGAKLRVHLAITGGVAGQAVAVSMRQHQPCGNTMTPGSSGVSRDWQYLGHRAGSRVRQVLLGNPVAITVSHGGDMGTWSSRSRGTLGIACGLHCAQHSWGRHHGDVVSSNIPRSHEQPVGSPGARTGWCVPTVSSAWRSD